MYLRVMIGYVVCREVGEDERGRKGREVLWNDVRYYAEGEYEGIRSKILRVQFKFTRVNCVWCVIID